MIILFDKSAFEVPNDYIVIMVFPFYIKMKTSEKYLANFR